MSVLPAWKLACYGLVQFNEFAEIQLVISIAFFITSSGSTQKIFNRWMWNNLVFMFCIAVLMFKYYSFMLWKKRCCLHLWTLLAMWPFCILVFCYAILVKLFPWVISQEMANVSQVDSPSHRVTTICDSLFGSIVRVNRDYCNFACVWPKPFGFIEKSNIVTHDVIIPFCPIVNKSFYSYQF